MDFVCGLPIDDVAAFIASLDVRSLCICFRVCRLSTFRRIVTTPMFDCGSLPNRCGCGCGMILFVASFLPISVSCFVIAPFQFVVLLLSLLSLFGVGYLLLLVIVFVC